MAKLADKYFKLDPWSIVESGYDPSKNMVAESVFSLGNEYMGVRGYLEEGVSSQSLVGSYFNGVYDYATEWTKSAYKGIAERTHFMVNSVNWLKTDISIDGESLDVAKATIDGFVRVLNLKQGTLLREFVWTTLSGKKLKLSFLRFLSMTRPHEAFQQIRLEALNFDGKVEIEMGLDFDVLHFGRTCFWECACSGEYDDATAIVAQTLTTGQRVFSGFEISCSEPITKEFIKDQKYVGQKVKIDLMKDKIVTLQKYVTNHVEKDGDKPLSHVLDNGLSLLKNQVLNSFENALQEQYDFWHDVWQNFDIEIHGDEENQQGIRFCIFQLHQTYHGQSASNNIGAKGLTGEAYSGHAFWDTETYCLPFYLFNNVRAAKNLLEFRYSTLQRAMDRAKELDCKGACYPIATLNGKEGCNLWQHASLQFQPSTGVFYGIWHYDKIVGDKQFLYGHGIEMLIQISRFLLSRGSYSQTRNKFGFYSVMGPDEFHMMVNNNCYTNLMAKKAFEYTAEVVQEMKLNAPDKLREVQEKTGFSDDECKTFLEAAESTIIPLDESSGIYEQHEGYFDLPHIDVDEIPISDFPLYHNWSYDRIYRTDMIKQPDVLMFMFLYNSEYTKQAKMINYEYYEPRTIHESSLSPSIHSIFASELGKHEEAYEFFHFATRMDLDNYNRNTSEGLHTTSIAAAWVNIVYGFGGMRSDGEILSFAPSIPAAWDSYNFRIAYKSSTLHVNVTKKQAEFKLIGSNSVQVMIYGKIYQIEASGVCIDMEEI